MYVDKVLLQSFRNYESVKVELSQGLNVFYGDNAQGKTNFLEAIYLCSTGRSQRTHLDREMIQFHASEAHIQLFVKNSETSYADKIDVHLKKGDKKGIAINGVPIKKLGQLFGHLLTVVFSPEDLQIIKAGPTERRRFMDVELCQLSNIYYYELQEYYHILKQRNNLLKDLKYKPELRETVFVWDSQMAAHGSKIIEMRKDFIEKIKELAESTHASLTNSTESLNVVYKPNVSANDFFDKLTKSLERDIMLGSTSVGIHKDDIHFLINNLDARIYGSQGQQRTAALSLKMAEIKLVKEQKNNSPVLLLDDVLSELDESRQNYFLNNKYLSDDMQDLQVVITCAGIDDTVKRITNRAKHNVSVYNVKNGVISLG